MLGGIDMYFFRALNFGTLISALARAEYLAIHLKGKLPMFREKKRETQI